MKSTDIKNANTTAGSPKMQNPREPKKDLNQPEVEQKVHPKDEPVEQPKAEPSRGQPKGTDETPRKL